MSGNFNNYIFKSEQRFCFAEGEQSPGQIASAEINRHSKQKDLSVIAGDTDLQLAAKEKTNLLAGKYAKFSRAAELPTRGERLRVEGFKSVKIRKKR